MSFKFESFVQPVVNTAKSMTDTLVKDETARKSINSLIDAQFEYTKAVMTYSAALAGSVYDNVKNFDPAKMFAAK
jgi:hypothetical protein